MIRMHKTILSSSIIAACCMASSVFAAEPPPITDELVSLGERVYAIECSSCHGTEGAGDGPGAHYVNPRPRNFELAVYKLRSTPNGELPTAHDLFNTITNGINNSMMPSFKALPEKERWALVEVIRRFGGIEEEEGVPITVSAAPDVTAESIANGRSLYEQLDCSSCHGVGGMGDGPSSLTLENDAEERVWAANLTTGIYKGGSTPADLYQRIANGLDGSPMPSYSEEANPEEIWDVVNYLRSIVVSNN